MYQGGDISRKPNPKAKTNFLSRITFFFTFDLLRKGYRKDITEDEIYEVLPKFKSSRVGDKLEKEWMAQTEGKRKPSIYRLLWNCYGRFYLFLGIVQLCMKIIMITVLPRTQGKLISYFTSTSKLSKGDAVYYGTLVIVLNIIITTYNHNYRFLITELGIKMKTAFCSLIYKKSLKLTTSALSQNGIGKIVTLLSKDVNSFENAIVFWNDMWISLIVFVVASCIMYTKIGVASLAGTSLLIFVIPLQVYLGKLTSSLRLKAAKATDERLQTTQQTLSAIKFIKMQTWENYFTQKISKARKEEMRRIKQFYFARATFTEIGTFIITFTWYILITTYISLGNNLTAEIAFFLRECLRALRSPVTISIPLGMLRSGELVASANRVYEVLTAKEQEEICRESVDQPSIFLENVAVKVDDDLVLCNISVRMNSGLNLIAGEVGSGKSLLLKTILEDFSIFQGEMKITGSVSYAAQDPWLFPASIKQNILFGQDLDQIRYKEVLRVCALQADVDTFKDGDQTIVDDNGRNLSKGQQVRISLARAVYCDRDIYLLDDCLSCLDVHVQEFVAIECIENFLKDKIIVMVSYNEKLLQKAEKIFVMEKGTIKSCVKPPQGSKKEIEEIYEKDNIVDEITEDQEHSDEVTGLLVERTCQNIYHEEAKKGKVDFAVYRKYFRHGGGLLILTWIISLYVATQAGIFYAAKSVSSWVNIQQKIFEKRLTNETKIQELLEEDRRVLNTYTIAIVGAICFLCLRIYNYFSFAAKTSIHLHKSMLTSIANSTMKFFDYRYFGNILNRFAKDMYNIDEILPFNIDECLKFVFNLFRIMLLIIFVSVDFLVPMIILFIILFFMRRIYISTGRSLQRLDSATRSPVIGHFNATLEGLSTIRAQGTQQMLRKEFDKYQDLYISAIYMEQSASRAFAYCLDMLCNFFIAAIIIRFLVAEKDTQAGDVGLAIAQALSLPGLFQFGIRQWADLENHMTSVERVLEYSNAEQENKSGQIMENVQLDGKISYKRVNLKYDNSKDYTLKGLSFMINSGEKIGIVGRTGAGKSSVISILFRLYQYEGTISINDVDIKTIPLDFLRSNIVIISQDPFIFNGTIRENIDPTGLYKDEEIWESINRVNLQHLIPSLDYEIVENGSNFSSGEKQLICLVRALVSKNKIVILDEATANVDSDTDALISKIIKDNFKKCTVLIVAHRLNNILNSDKIMVIDKGEVVEFDEVNVLTNKEDGFFYKMVLRSNLLTK